MAGHPHYTTFSDMVTNAMLVSMDKDWLKLSQKVIVLLILLVALIYLSSMAGQDQGWTLLFIVVFGSPILVIVSFLIVIGSILRIKRLTKSDWVFFVVGICSFVLSAWYCWKLFTGQ
ncbi:MAG: hypothetical protein V4481_05540 [Patescibacteria group bacterium]